MRARERLGERERERERERVNAWQAMTSCRGWMTGGVSVGDGGLRDGIVTLF